MRTVAVLIAVLVSVSFAVPADAQGNHRERLNAMKAQNPTGYATCHALAIQRGYNDVDQESEGLALMHFISGCIMGQQR